MTSEEVDGPPSDVSSVNHYPHRDDLYRSLPPYLRSSTETVMMSHEFGRTVRDCSPPPLPPKERPRAAPPRPPPLADLQPAEGVTGRRHESRQLEKTHRDKPKLPATQNLARNDSLSSLSLDSFGSTDREIFEETVKAGLSSVNPRAQYALDSDKVKAHSVERKPEAIKHNRHHKSLDRSDKISHRGTKVKDPEFERNLAAGAYNVKSPIKIKKLEQDFANMNITRSPYSYHGET